MANRGKITVTTTGSSRVTSSNNATVRHKSSSSSKKKNSSGSSPITKTSPVVANLPTPELTPSQTKDSPPDIIPDSGEPLPSENASAAGIGPNTVSAASASESANMDFAQNDFLNSYVAGLTGLDRGINPLSEYANPLETIGFTTGAISAIVTSSGKFASSIGKNIQIGKVAPASKAVKSASQLPVNTKVTKWVSNSVAKTLRDLKKPKNLLTAVVATVMSYAWNGHLKADNVIGGYSIAMRDAMQAGDLESAALVKENLDEFLDPNMWDKIIDSIPGVNVGKTAMVDIMKQAKITSDVYQKQLDDARAGFVDETPQDNYVRTTQERTESQSESTDYFNEQRILTDQRIRDAEVANRNEDAAFWKKYYSDLDKAELEHAKAQADFWLEYDKEKAKQDLLQADQYTPSKLNFGLI